MAHVLLAGGDRPGGLPVGTQLGRYEIAAFLARGGMAEVYLARARGVGGFEKTVALKRLAPERVLSGDGIAMFLDEARLAARLEHPNIVQVFDAGEEGGVVFLAMEHVDGVDLRTLIAAERARGRALPLGPALAIGIHIATALHHAHELCAPDGRRMHLVHRDVSPSNILLSRTGTVKLADFGIAKAVDHRSVTRAGENQGKAAYMAPEQRLAMPVDRRTDVFALGVVLVEMTTGARPFDDAGNELPRLARPPAALDRVLARALAREPAGRLATAEELRAELERVAGSLNVDLSPRALATYLAELQPSAPRRDSDPMDAAFVTGSAVRSEPSRPPRLGRTAGVIAAAGAVLAVAAAALWPGSEATGAADMDEAAAPESLAVTDEAGAIAAPAGVEAGAIADPAGEADPIADPIADPAGEAGAIAAPAALGPDSIAAPAALGPDSIAARADVEADPIPAPDPAASEPVVDARPQRSTRPRRRPRPGARQRPGDRARSKGAAATAPDETEPAREDSPDALFPGSWRPR